MKKKKSYFKRAFIKQDVENKFVIGQIIILLIHTCSATWIISLIPNCYTAVQHTVTNSIGKNYRGKNVLFNKILHFGFKKKCTENTSRCKNKIIFYLDLDHWLSIPIIAYDR